MENLYIHEDLDLPPNWTDDIENAEWLNLLLPFTAVKNLHLSKPILPRIAPVLQELAGARTTEVLPALIKVVFEGSQPWEPVQEGIVQFISARRFIENPVASSAWDRNLVPDVPRSARQYISTFAVGKRESQNETLRFRAGKLEKYWIVESVAYRLTQQSAPRAPYRGSYLPLPICDRGATFIVTRGTGR
jgi:hypothetical protein